MLSVVGVKEAPSVNAAERQAIFAANRATGHIALGVAARAGRTHRTRVHEDGSLRVRFPNAPGDVLEAVIVNTGGGMTGGDRFAIDIVLDEGASLVAGTAAAEKIYRSTGPDAEMDVTLTIGAGAQACLAAAGNHSVRPRASVAPHRYRSGRKRLAADGGGGGVRPRRHGRGDCRRASSPTAGACAAPASSCSPTARGSTAPSPGSWRQPLRPPAASPSPPC